MFDCNFFFSKFVLKMLLNKKRETTINFNSFRKIIKSSCVSREFKSTFFIFVDGFQDDIMIKEKNFFLNIYLDLFKFFLLIDF